MTPPRFPVLCLYSFTTAAAAAWAHAPDSDHACLVRRQEGIHVTAKTVEDRLAQLIGGRGPDSSDIAEVEANLSKFQASHYLAAAVRQHLHSRDQPTASSLLLAAALSM